MGWEWPQRCSDLDSMHFSPTGCGSDSPCPADELYCWCCVPAFPPPLRLFFKKQIFCIFLGLKGTPPAFTCPNNGATWSKRCDSKTENPRKKGKWQEMSLLKPIYAGFQMGKDSQDFVPSKASWLSEKKIECGGLSTVRGHSYIILKHAKREYIYFYG